MLCSYLNKPLLMQEAENNEKQEPVSTDNDNFGIARNLASARHRFVYNLAVSPVSAVWLLHKYPDTPIDQNGFVQETFLVHAFSFNDLQELVDLAVLWFKQRGLIYEEKKQPFKKREDAVHKRLTHSKRFTKPIYVELLKNALLNLSDDCVYQQVLDIVNAEYDWLAVRQQLVEKNSKLVSYIANQHKSSFLDFEDLVQEGHTGLLVAVDKFDYRLGCQFSTYAVHWIRQRILRALSQNERVVRLPYEQIGTINRIFRARDELFIKTGEEPSVDSLAKYLNMSNEDVSTLLAISQTAVPLENSDDDDNESLMPIDVVEQHIFQTPFRQLARSEFENWLEKAVKILNARELRIVCSHFGLYADKEMTLQEIGAELNISRERVRQIQVTAFNKIKLNYGEQLVSFL